MYIITKLPRSCYNKGLTSIKGDGKMNENQYEVTYNVDYFNIDQNKRLTIPSLIDMFNNTAFIQSESLGLGLDFLSDENITWVFCKLALDLKRIPAFNETIICNTYCSGNSKYFASRNFEIFSENRELLGTAQGLYFLIDLSLRKPIKISDEIFRAFGTTEKTTCLKNLKIAPLPLLESTESFKVKFYDIDTNGHVNNGVYAKWILESLPKNYLLNKELLKLEIIFENEVLLGETIKVEKHLDNNITTHTIYKENGTIAALGRITWN